MGSLVRRRRFGHHSDVDSIRVLVVDDHPVVRRGLRALLSSLDGVSVVGEGGDGESAVREAVLLAPDVVIMDIQMPGIDGIEATRRITAAAPGCAVIVLSMFVTDETAVTVLEAGARGHLLKDADQEEIAQALKAVAAGQVVLEPSVAARLLNRSSSAPPEVALPGLTVHERQVLDRLPSSSKEFRRRTSRRPPPPWWSISWPLCCCCRDADSAIPAAPHRRTQRSPHISRCGTAGAPALASLPGQRAVAVMAVERRR